MNNMNIIMKQFHGSVPLQVIRNCALNDASISFYFKWLPRYLGVYLGYSA